MTIRIGNGFDVHAFERDPSRALVLAGVTFEGEWSLRGHSDADVVAHSVAEAVLGAAGLGDLGSHFPDTDERWAGFDSMEMLAQVIGMIEEQGWAVSNVDCSVVAERPKLAHASRRDAGAAGCGAEGAGQREGATRRRVGLTRPRRGDRLLHLGPARVRRGAVMGSRDGRSKGRGRSRSDSRSGSGSRSRAGGRSPSRGSGGDAQRRSGGSGTKGGGTRKTPKGLDGTQVEGRQAVRELLLGGRRRVREVYLGNEVERIDIVSDIVGLAQELKVPVREVSRSKLDHLSRTDAPQGVLAVAEQLPAEELRVLCNPADGGAAFLLALDGVTDPGNLGALLRIAECAGVTGVVLPRHRAAHVTPTVTKTAAGAVEYLPMSLVGGLPTAIEEMKEAGVWVVGLDAGGETSVHDLELGAESVCLVLGAEGKGLSRLVRQRCDLLASIPLRGRLASLNVASAGAIACYEVARRR